MKVHVGLRIASAMTLASRKKSRSAVSEQPSQTQHALHTPQHTTAQRPFQARKPTGPGATEQRDPIASMGAIIPCLHPFTGS
jgi:hypothetical protein